MALSAVLGVIFAYLRKRSVEAAGLDRIVTRRYLEANILFYGLIAIALLFFWNWFDLHFDPDPQDTDNSIVWIIVDTIGPLLWARSACSSCAAIPTTRNLCRKSE